jgi:uncharacterized protein (TIGR00297 family)
LGDRKLNYLFSFITIALFVLEASVSERYDIMIAFTLAFVVGFAAFFLNILSLDGARASIIVGTMALGFGGIEAASLIFAFFVSSNLVGLPFGKKHDIQNQAYNPDRRSGVQVWANAFWFIIFICTWFVLKADMFLIAAFAALATANADTWSTEVGIRFKKKRPVLITTFKPVEVGTDGAISLPGIIAGLFGALFIGSISLLFDKNALLLSGIVIAIAGFLGSIVDSYIGAFFQTGKRQFPSFLGNFGDYENSMVNFLSTGGGALIGLILYNILYYVVV